MDYVWAAQWQTVGEFWHRCINLGIDLSVRGTLSILTYLNLGNSYSVCVHQTIFNLLLVARKGWYNSLVSRGSGRLRKNSFRRQATSWGLWLVSSTSWPESNRSLICVCVCVCVCVYMRAQEKLIAERGYVWYSICDAPSNQPLATSS